MKVNTKTETCHVTGLCLESVARSECEMRIFLSSLKAGVSLYKSNGIKGLKAKPHRLPGKHGRLNMCLSLFLSQSYQSNENCFKKRNKKNKEGINSQGKEKWERQQWMRKVNKPLEEKQAMGRVIITLAEQIELK